MPRQLEQTPRCCCNSAFGGFPRASGSDSSCLRRLILPACRPLARTVLHSCIKGFLRAKKLWVNPPKAERAKPSLSSDYNLLFKNKIGESSLDIHRRQTLHPSGTSATEVETFQRPSTLRSDSETFCISDFDS